MYKHGWREKLQGVVEAHRGDTGKTFAIQSTMKQPTNQEERNEDKKKPEKENPSHGIDPERKEPEMEAEKKLVIGQFGNWVSLHPELSEGPLLLTKHLRAHLLARIYAIEHESDQGLILYSRLSR
jgi:hypothetical protein